MVSSASAWREREWRERATGAVDAILPGDLLIFGLAQHLDARVRQALIIQISTRDNEAMSRYGKVLWNTGETSNVIINTGTFALGGMIIRDGAQLIRVEPISHSGE